jgi:hypothetical protein
MKLTDFDKKNYAPQALKETYKMTFDVSKMSLVETKSWLKKVRTLANEAKSSPDFYKNPASPAYMKLVFMEQALVSHHNELASRPSPTIVVENAEVEKSQVVLAIQDMVDSVQKMVEDVSDILVKELPALTDSIQSEIGVNEAEQFNSQVVEALTSLTAALTQSKTTLQGALNTITGQGDMGAGAFADPAADPMADPMADPAAAAGGDLGAGDEAGFPPADDMGGAAPEEVEAPEAMPVGGVGRAKR